MHVAAGGAAVVAALGAPIAAHACAATTGMNLSLTSGPAGRVISLQGSNFASETAVEVHWGSVDGPLLATAMGGDFVTQITIPQVTPGLYAIDATDNVGPIAFISEIFSVTPPVAPVGTGSAGSPPPPLQPSRSVAAPPAPPVGSPARAAGATSRAGSGAGALAAPSRENPFAAPAAAPITAAPPFAAGGQPATQVLAAQPVGSIGLGDIADGLGPYRGQAAVQPAAHPSGGGHDVATMLLAVALPLLLIGAVAIGARARHAAASRAHRS
jgi:hypothetical protein